MGLPTPAAWDVVNIGSYVWHDGTLGRVRAKGHTGATIAVFTAGVTPRRVAARANVKFAMSGSEVLHYDSPPLLVDTASLTTSGCVHVQHREIQALRAVETRVLCPADPRLEAACSAALSTAGWPDIQQDASRVDSDDATLTHEMLPWGCHYRNLVPQAGHAWVAADLSADPQVKRAANEAAALSAAEDRPQPTPALLAYSDGSVTANGALGSAAAILCIGTHGVSTVVRLASADTALSSGRSEWTGLLLVLYVAKHVRGDLIVRLDNLQVVNAFTDGPWKFRRNWLRRNDRDLASLAWRLANDRQLAGLGSTTVLHQLGHPEKRKWPEQFDTHEVYNSKVDARTHQINGVMPLYVSFRRTLHGHTTVSTMVPVSTAPLHPNSSHSRFQAGHLCSEAHSLPTVLAAR